VPNDFLLDMALRHFDFTEDQITQIKAAIPKVAYVANLVENHKTVINELIDIINMVAAQVAKKESQ
jgi:hypothetical protein